MVLADCEIAKLRSFNSQVSFDFKNTEIRDWDVIGAYQPNFIRIMFIQTDLTVLFPKIIQRCPNNARRHGSSNRALFLFVSSLVELVVYY